MKANSLGADPAAQKAKDLYPGKITIGYVIFPGYFSLIVADEKGYFKDQGLNVELRQYVGLNDLSQDYTSGKMQGRANVNFDAVKEYFSGFDHRAVLAIDYSNGVDAILATPQIQTIQELQGKNVAYEPETLEEFFLTWALSESEMSLSDITAVFADPEKSALLLKEGKVDAAVTYEPFISQHLNSPAFTTIYCSKATPGILMDVLTFRTDFIENYPKTIEAFIRAYFKGLAYSRQHPEEAWEITAKRFNDTGESIGNQLKGIKTLDERDNQVAFTFAAGMRSLYSNMRQIAKFIHKHQKPTTLAPPDTDKLIERKFIQKIINEKNQE